MGTLLSSRVKVVLSISLIVLLTIAAAPTTSAQSENAVPVNDGITISCNRLLLIDVIESLSKITGLHFIYSSDKINANQTVTLYAVNEPLESVLLKLGGEALLDFRVEGRYVIVKPSTNLPVPVTRPQQQPASSAIKGEEEISANAILYRTIDTAVPTFRNDIKANDLIVLTNYFDSATLRQIPHRYLKKFNLNDRHAGWFASVGPFVNNYSVGLEVQGGIRAAYFVGNVGALRDGTLKYAYGLGTSIPLTRNFAIQPIYTFSTLRKEYAEAYQVNGWTGVQDVDLTTRHHQFKLMLQYTWLRNVALRLGVSVNLINSQYRYEQPPNFFSRHQADHYSTYQKPAPGSYTTGSTQPAPPRTTGTETLEHSSTWIGWEAGIAYRLSFFQHK